LQMKRYWAVLEALRQLVHQEIRRLFRRIRCGEMLEVLRHQLITDCLPRAHLVDEHESIHAIVLFVGKAIGRGQGAKGRGHGRMARRELIEFCRTRLLLEYDDDRSGSFAPLRHVPDDKMVVLGLISTKRRQMEAPEDLVRRVTQATPFVPLERLALLGDDTPWRLGPARFNPLKPVDPFGTILFPGVLLRLRSPFIFGYAKPVPINFRAVRRPRRDMVLVAAAGPAMNIALAVAAALAFPMVGY